MPVLSLTTTTRKMFDSLENFIHDRPLASFPDDVWSAYEKCMVGADPGIYPDSQDGFWEGFMYWFEIDGGDFDQWGACGNDPTFEVAQTCG